LFKRQLSFYSPKVNSKIFNKNEYITEINHMTTTAKKVDNKVFKQMFTPQKY